MNEDDVIEDEAKLQRGWDWTTNDLAKLIIEKEQEIEAELFYPILLVALDALRIRGMPEDEIKEVVKDRLTIDLNLDDE